MSRLMHKETRLFQTTTAMEKTKSMLQDAMAEVRAQYKLGGAEKLH